ncbi:hypothetical protein [Lysinibacillus sp. NPDC093216]|uniref:hypothetical protein n=1 Tax=Lysinibacillus sp. NPDC093216 TaxID=3390576 RepID=UPI003D04AF9B
MAEKVKVSREVKEARESVLKKWTLTEVFNMCTADFDVFHENMKALRKWHYENNDEGEGLMNLLLGNYKVELSPKEQVSDYYSEIKSHVDFSESKGELNKTGEDALKIIRDITTILGHKIKGVNE